MARRQSHPSSSIANLRSLPRRAREFVHSCSVAPQATPEQAAQVLRLQVHAIVDQLRLAAGAKLVLLVLFLWEFGTQASDAWFAPLSVAHAAINGFNLVLCEFWERRPPSWMPRPTIRRWLALDLAIAGGLDAVLAVYGFNVGNETQRLLVVAVTGTMISMGGWMFSPLLHAGIGWVVSICSIAAIGIGLTQWHQQQALVVIIVVYAFALSAAVMLAARLYLQNLMTAQHLEQQNQLVGLLLNDFEANASDWLWETDARGRLVHVSQRLAQALGRSQDALLGQPFMDLLEALDPSPPEPVPRHRQALASVLSGDKPFRDLVVPVALSDKCHWWSLTAKPLKSARGRHKGWRGVGSDVTTLRERDDELTRLANVDSLTGLANRHCFELRLAELFENLQAISPCALLMVDLDNFKSVNDSLGHAAGDALLCEVAKRLQSQLDADTLLARLGGDEFALIVPGEPERERIQDLGDRLQAALGQPCSIQDHSIEIQASIGVAFAPSDAATAAKLLQVSDMALYEAKAAGRCTLRFFRPEMAEAVSHKLGLLADLREAVRLEQFVLHYQPQIDLVHGRLVGFEALVRWRHPTRGLVPPVQFIPLAEDSGLIVPLGQWVLQQACRDAKQWMPHLRVAVNISAVEFERSDVRRNVQEALRLSGLPVRQLELELTESTLLQDSDKAVRLLHALRESGVRVALDDFGTGFSSLAYLRSFPLDALKIDRSFVRTLDATDDKSALAIVRAIQGVATALELETIAEGVETVAQQQVLTSIGCSTGQGFLFAKPLRVDQVEQFIANCTHGSLDEACAAVKGEIVDDKLPTSLLRDAKRIAGGRPAPPDSRWTSLN